MWVPNNKLYLVPKWVVAIVIGVLRNGGCLGTGKSCILIMLFDPLLHRSSCFANVYFSAFTGNPVDTLSCFAGSKVSLGHTKCVLSVMSDLKTVQMPCCCRQFCHSFYI